MSLEWKKREVKRAVERGSDAEIREATEDLFGSAFFSDKEEVADFIADTLKERKWGTRTLGNETIYDGITVKTGSFPKVEIEEPYEDEY